MKVCMITKRVKKWKIILNKQWNVLKIPFSTTRADSSKTNCLQDMVKRDSIFICMRTFVYISLVINKQWK